MPLKKTVLVLKNLEDDYSSTKSPKGIARFELEDGVCNLFLSLINLFDQTGGQFYLHIIDKNNAVYNFKLNSRPISFKYLFDPPLNFDAIAVGIYLIKNEIPRTVAFAKTENFALTLSDFKKSVAEKVLAERKKQCAVQNNILPKEQKDNAQPPTDNTYDDEAVATVDYYALDENISDKINKLEKVYNGKIPTDNKLSDSRNAQKTQKDDETTAVLKDERDYITGENPPNDHYRTVKEELERILVKFATDSPLQKYFPDSRWAKINYSQNKHYVVGVIKERGLEKYICYGIPAKYTPAPPKQLKGYCSFIPLSIFNTSGDGYWMMFQDAHSGDCVHPE